MLESNNDRKKFQCIDMESRRGNAIGKNEANAVGVTHSAASMKTRVHGKTEGLEIPESGLDQRNTRKPRKKIKPPLYVQEHSSRNEVTVTSWPLALAKTVKEASHEDSAGFNTRGDEGELPQQGL